jgi:hypothetical protein
MATPMQRGELASTNNEVSGEGKIEEVNPSQQSTTSDHRLEPTKNENYEVVLPAVTLLERPDFSASSPVLSISIEPLK